MNSFSIFIVKPSCCKFFFFKPPTTVTTIYYDFSNDLEVRTFFDLGFIPNPCISPSMTIPGGLPIGDQFYQRLYVSILAEFRSLALLYAQDYPISAVFV